MKTIGGLLLLLLSLFMALGFARSDPGGGAAVWLAVLIAVVLPGVGGVALLTAPLRTRLGLERRKARIEQDTLDAEVLRLASRHAGRLTVLEVVSELGIPEARAVEVLNGFHGRDRAELEVTASGVIVYRFHDIQHMGEKADARGILDV
jgi:hypothetical protein